MHYVTIKPINKEISGLCFFIKQEHIPEEDKERGTFRLINNLLTNYYDSKDSVMLPDFEVPYDDADTIDVEFEKPMPVTRGSAEKRWVYRIFDWSKVPDQEKIEDSELEGRVKIYSYGARVRRDEDVPYNSQDFLIFFNMYNVDSFEERDAFVEYANKHWRELLQTVVS